VVQVFKSTESVSDYGWSQVRDPIHKSLTLKLERRNDHDTAD
jgi:hypothetical protein